MLNFTPIPTNTVTKRWSVESYQSLGVPCGGGDPRHSLGEVRWYAPWRRYAFYPRVNTLFDYKCLNELSEFLLSETNKRKEERG